MNDQLIKTEFDFGWKKWSSPPIYAELTLKYQKGDILDVGCATCELYKFLRKNGWNRKYYGIDIKKYEDYEYPDDVNLIIGNALELEFPDVDTILLYNILEHVEDPLALLNKAFGASRKNVLIHVPQRNEELWKHGIAEYHQLDKTHKHCGFSKEEIYNIIDLAGGKFRIYKDIEEVNATIGINLWNNNIPRLLIMHLFKKIFSSKVYYHDMWIEVVKK